MTKPPSQKTIFIIKAVTSVMAVLDVTELMEEMPVLGRDGTPFCPYRSPRCP